MPYKIAPNEYNDLSNSNTYSHHSHNNYVDDIDDDLNSLFNDVPTSRPQYNNNTTLVLSPYKQSLIQSGHQPVTLTDLLNDTVNDGNWNQHHHPQSHNNQSVVPIESVPTHDATSFNHTTHIQSLHDIAYYQFLHLSRVFRKWKQNVHNSKEQRIIHAKYKHNIVVALEYWSTHKQTYYFYQWNNQYQLYHTLYDHVYQAYIHRTQQQIFQRWYTLYTQRHTESYQLNKAALHYINKRKHYTINVWYYSIQQHKHEYNTIRLFRLHILFYCWLSLTRHDTQLLHNAIQYHNQQLHSVAAQYIQQWYMNTKQYGKQHQLQRKVINSYNHSLLNNALKHWRTQYNNIDTLQYNQTRAIIYWAQCNGIRCIHIWHQTIARKKQYQYNITLADKLSVYRIQYNALYMWCNQLRRAQHIAQSNDLLTHNTTQQLMKSALYHWITLYNSVAHLDTRADQHHTHFILSSAFHCMLYQYNQTQLPIHTFLIKRYLRYWYNAANDGKHQKQLDLDIIHHYETQLCKRLFLQWKSFRTRIELTQQRKLQYTSAADIQYNNILKLTAFNHIHQLSTNRNKARRVINIMLAARQYPLLRYAFNQLRCHAIDTIKYQQRQHIISTILLPRLTQIDAKYTIRRGLQQWYINVQHMKRLHQSSKQINIYHQHSTIKLYWRTWKYKLHIKRTQREASQLFCNTHIVQPALRHTFTKWYTAYNTEHKIQLYQHQHDIKHMHSTIQHWHTIAQQQAIDDQQVQYIRQQLSLTPNVSSTIRQLFHRAQHLPVILVFEQWSNYIQTQRHQLQQKQLADQYYHSLLQYNTYIQWTQWYTYRCNIQHILYNKQLQQQKPYFDYWLQSTNKQLNSKIDNIQAVNLWANNTVIGVFRLWYYHAIRHKQLLRAYQSTVMLSNDSLMYNVLQQWRTLSLDCRIGRIQLNVADNVYHDKLLYGAYQIIRNKYVMCIQQQHTADSMIHNTMHVVINVVFVRWYSYVARRHHIINRVHTIQQQKRHRLQNQLFLQWKQYTQQQNKLHNIFVDYAINKYIGLAYYHWCAVYKNRYQIRASVNRANEYYANVLIDKQHNIIKQWMLHTKLYKVSGSIYRDSLQRSALFHWLHTMYDVQREREIDSNIELEQQIDIIKLIYTQWLQSAQRVRTLRNSALLYTTWRYNSTIYSTLQCCIAVPTYQYVQTSVQYHSERICVICDTGTLSLSNDQHVDCSQNNDGTNISITEVSSNRMMRYSNKSLSYHTSVKRYALLNYSQTLHESHIQQQQQCLADDDNDIIIVLHSKLLIKRSIMNAWYELYQLHTIASKHHNTQLTLYAVSVLQQYCADKKACLATRDMLYQQADNYYITLTHNYNALLFRHWYILTQYIVHQRHSHIVADKWHMDQTITRYINMWTQYTTNNKQQQFIYNTALNQLNQYRQLYSITQWHLITINSLVDRQKISIIQLKCIKYMFTAWYHRYTVKQQYKHIIHATNSAYEYKIIKSAYTVWYNQYRQSIVLKQMIYITQRSMCGKTLLHWKVYAIEQRCNSIEQEYNQKLLNDIVTSWYHQSVVQRQIHLADNLYNNHILASASQWMRSLYKHCTEINRHADKLLANTNQLLQQTAWSQWYDLYIESHQLTHRYKHNIFHMWRLYSIQISYNKTQMIDTIRYLYTTSIQQHEAVLKSVDIRRRCMLHSGIRALQYSVQQQQTIHRLHTLSNAYNNQSLLVSIKSALQQWQYYTAQRVQLRLLYQQADKIYTNRLLDSVVTLWYTELEQCYRSKKKCIVVIKSLNRYKLIITLHSWLTHVHAIQLQHTIDQYRVKSIQSRQSTVCYKHWKTRYMFIKYAQIVQNNRIRLLFNVWYNLFQSNITDEYNSIIYHNTSLVNQSYNQWFIQYIAQCKWDILANQQADMYYMNILSNDIKRFTFNVWYSETISVQQYKLAIQQITQRYQRRVYAYCFSKWRSQYVGIHNRNINNQPVRLSSIADVSQLILSISHASTNTDVAHPIHNYNNTTFSMSELNGTATSRINVARR